MNCKAVQRRLMSGESPENPEAELQGHLEVCGTCRDWQRRLLQIEHNVPLLPVPLSENRSTFIRQFVATGPDSKNGLVASTVGVPPRSDPRFDGTRSVPPTLVKLPTNRQSQTPWGWYAAAAAAVVIFFGGWALWAPRDDLGTGTPRKSGPVPDPLLSSLMQHDLRLAGDLKPTERVEALVALADDLQRQTCTLARVADAKDLLSLARNYQDVIQHGVVVRAEKVPQSEQRKVLHPIADKLENTEREAEDLARKVPTSAEPLRLIAKAARDGSDGLRNMLREGTP